MKTSVIKSNDAIARMVSIGAIVSMICLSTASAHPQVSSAAGVNGTRSMQHSIGQRSNLEQIRIEQGIESGRLTAAESTRIEKNEANIQSQRLSDRKADNGGKLTMSQREQLVRAQNRAASKIFQLKHNQHRTAPVGTNHSDTLRGKVALDQKQIAQGLASGELNAKQAGKLESRVAQIEAKMRSDRHTDNGGQLTAAQRKQLIRDEKSIAKILRQLKNKPSASA